MGVQHRIEPARLLPGVDLADIDGRAPAPETGRAEHTATLLTDGRVLVTGGIDPNYQATATAEIYDPRLDAWTRAR